MSYILAATFLFFAIWILSPDKEEDIQESNRYGAFLTTAVLFFLAEMGDKTKLATVALGARYADMVAVTLGTTLGMMVSDGLAVFFGDQLIKRVSMKSVRIGTAVLFAVFGLVTLVRA